MTESKILMQPSESCVSLSGIRFELSHAKDFFNPNKTALTPSHIHNCLEIFFNISSDASFFVNNGLYPLRYGDVVISMPNDIHVCIFNKSYTHEHFCLWIDISESEELFSFLLKKESSPVIRMEDEKQKELINLFLKLEKLCSENASDLQKTACFLEILVFLKTIAPPEHNNAQIPELLQTILDDIHVNFAQIHHINQLTKKHFVAHATLGRWFRKYLHTSPREYLESKKLAHAVKLLDNGATVTEACINSGFSCCSHFISLFKKKFGQTPLKYKHRE